MATLLELLPSERLAPRSIRGIAWKIVCTLTWWNSPEGYEVFFNRDERKTRLPALPPSVQEEGGTRFLAPTDGNAGGTWIATNEHGLTIAILNFYEREAAGQQGREFRSRGLLMRDLAMLPSLEAVDATIRAEAGMRYQAFTLVAFSGENGFRARKWQWNGVTLASPEHGPTIPVCSSSFLTEEVVRNREELLANLEGSVDSSALAAYHRENNAGNPTAHSVLMNRPDAQTWSISRIRVGAGKTWFEYEALPPNHDGVGEKMEIELSRV